MHGADEFPVDVWKIARGLGVTVLYGRWRGLPHAVCFHPMRLVLLNSGRPLCSQRFDLAHELAHYVLGVEEYHTCAANQFAAELLMPAHVFKLEALVHGVDGYVSDLFGVSETAAQQREKELRHGFG